MGLISALESRSENQCELCNASANLSAHTVAPRNGDLPEDQIVVCPTCAAQISGTADLDINHLRCLNESMWSQVPAVQVVTYRLLHQLRNEGWAQDAIGMMYLEESTMEWAQRGLNQTNVVHKDSNGNVLSDGDTVTLIQDLNVKGAGFTAKRGTAVRRIRLVSNNAEHIEGKIEGQQIVILTKYVKKAT